MNWMPWALMFFFMLLCRVLQEANDKLSRRVRTEENAHQSTRFVLQQLLTHLAAKSDSGHEKFCELHPAKIHGAAEHLLDELELVLKQGKKPELARFVRSHFAATWDDAHAFVRRWKETPRDQKLLLIEAAVWNENVTEIRNQVG